MLVRDDFWLAASRFMRDLEIRLVEAENSALVDLFDPRHARKVLMAFGRAYGALPKNVGDLSSDQDSFLDQSISGLVQDGKIISVRLALFAEMVKGKPWAPTTLSEVGGTEGIGLAFLEETFSASTAPPAHRLHQKAAQAVLKALLPESGTDIKGEMRSRQELLEASGYASRPRDFDDLIHILDPELRLITPTEPADSASETQATPASGRYYQLAHDYLVHSLREWLTRKQRETRRGRAELRLAERSASWNAKPENRHLPFALERANIRLLTGKRDWTEPQRRMMKRAGRVHGARGILTFALLTAGNVAGFAVRRQFIENWRATQAAGLVQRVLDAETAQVPDIVGAMGEYRQWVDSSLRSELEKSSADPRQKLHASLALLPVNAAQVGYLFDRLLKATPSELPVLRDALKANRATLTPKLWTVLESARPDDDALLPAAGALANYAPDDGKWEAVSGKVAQKLVSVNSLVLRPWIDALRPVRGKLTAPLESIFRDKSRPETVHSLATDILTDYASDDPDRLAELLMAADSKAYVSFFPVAAQRAEQILPVFQAELAKKATYSWDDPQINPAWTKPDAALASGIESTDGLVADRFAFCQTMPLDEFLATAEALRKSGYRPIRFRPYADEQVVRVAAVWARDGRDWRVALALTPSEVVSLDATLQTGAARSEPGGPLESRLQAVPGPAKAGTPTQTPAQAGYIQALPALESRLQAVPGPAKAGTPTQTPAQAGYIQALPALESRLQAVPGPAKAGTPTQTPAQAGYIQALPALESRLQAVPGPAKAGTPTQTPAQAGYIQALPALESRLQAVPGPAKAGTPTQTPAQAGYIPVDVAGYVTLGADGKPIDRYAALWVEKKSDDDARLYVGMSADEQDEIHDKLKDAKLIPRTENAVIGPDGRPRYCGVWGRPAEATTTGKPVRDQFERNFEQNQSAELSDQLLIDLALCGASKSQPAQVRAQADLEKAEKKLKTKPDDVDARFSRAIASFRLGENQKALADLQVVIAKNPKAAAGQPAQSAGRRPARGRGGARPAGFFRWARVSRPRPEHRPKVSCLRGGRRLGQRWARVS